VGLEWSNDPESYVKGRIATVMASHVRQVKGDDPDKKEYPGPPGGGWGLKLTISSRKKYICLEASNIGNWTEITKTTHHEQGYEWKYGKCHLCIEVAHCRT
jgi:hypothetical protein